MAPPLRHSDKLNYDHSPVRNTTSRTNRRNSSFDKRSYLASLDDQAGRQLDDSIFSVRINVWGLIDKCQTTK